MKFSSMLKRILSLVLVLSIVFALLCTTSCKKKDDDKDGETPDNTEQPDGPKDGSIGRNEFIDELGGVSDTYVGAVSEEAYSSAQEAAQAFVSNEIAGEEMIWVTDTTSKGELSSGEIQTLGIPEADKEGMLGVEKLEVTYSSIDTAPVRYGRARVNTADAGGETLDTSRTVVVYVIKYENNWKYFSPAPITGNTITKSYYDSVFNYEKYKNCTFKSETAMTIEIKGNSGSESINMTVEMNVVQLIKHADGKVYLEQTIDMTQDGVRETQIIYAYLEEVDGELVCYVKMEEGGSWYPTYISAIGFSDIEELTPFYDQYLDYTYFTKTEYGFALEKDNAALYISEALSGIDGFGSIAAGTNLDIDMFAEYYVSGGVLSGMRMDAQIIMNVSESGTTVNMVENATGTITCTDYGTTVVEKPFSE